MAYGDSKGLNIRTVAEKVLRDKIFNIVKNRKYDWYQRGLASIFSKCLYNVCIVHLKMKIFII